eukprot:SAG11_NODE_16850_length_535_cov_1.155963_1_plen_49_part_01
MLKGSDGQSRPELAQLQRDGLAMLSNVKTAEEAVTAILQVRARPPPCSP